MTVVVFFQAKDALVALADGWTHHRRGLREDAFDTRKLYALQDDSGQVLSVVGMAGRAYFGTDSVESVLVKHQALLRPPVGFPVTTGAVARRLALLCGDLAEQYPRDDSDHRLDLLVGGFRQDHTNEVRPGWYLARIDGDGDGLETCPAEPRRRNAGSRVSVQPDSWHWESVGSEEVAGLIADSLDPTNLQVAAEVVSQLRTNLPALAREHADAFLEGRVGGQWLIWTVAPSRFVEERLQSQ